MGDGCRFQPLIFQGVTTVSSKMTGQPSGLTFEWLNLFVTLQYKEQRISLVVHFLSSMRNQPISATNQNHSWLMTFLSIMAGVASGHKQESYLCTQLPVRIWEEQPLTDIHTCCRMWRSDTPETYWVSISYNAILHEIFKGIKQLVRPPYNDHVRIQY